MTFKRYRLCLDARLFIFRKRSILYQLNFCFCFGYIRKNPAELQLSVVLNFQSVYISKKFMPYVKLYNSTLNQPILQFNSMVFSSPLGVFLNWWQIKVFLIFHHITVFFANSLNFSRFISLFASSETSQHIKWVCVHHKLSRCFITLLM